MTLEPVHVAYLLGFAVGLLPGFALGAAYVLRRNRR